MRAKMNMDRILNKAHLAKQLKNQEVDLVYRGRNDDDSDDDDSSILVYNDLIRKDHFLFHYNHRSAVDESIKELANDLGFDYQISKEKKHYLLDKVGLEVEVEVARVKSELEEIDDEFVYAAVFKRLRGDSLAYQRFLLSTWGQQKFGKESINIANFS